MDYAVTIINGLPRAGLDEGGVVPIDNWVSGPEELEHDQLILVRVPAETVSNNDGMLEVKVLMTSFKLVDVSSDAEAFDTPRYFGQLQLDEPNGPKVNDIKGMSRGPIFAFKRVNGAGGYRIVGLQSNWHQNRRIIIFCPFEALGNTLLFIMSKDKGNESQ